MIQYETNELYWGWTVLTVRVALLDAEWSKDEHLRVGKECTGEGVLKKYQAWKERIAAGEKVIRPAVRLKEEGEFEPGDAVLAVVDGRHRIAVMRDLGAEQIEIVVPSHHADRLRSLLS